MGEKKNLEQQKKGAAAAAAGGGKQTTWELGGYLVQSEDRRSRGKIYDTIIYKLSTGRDIKKNLDGVSEGGWWERVEYTRSKTS